MENILDVRATKKKFSSDFGTQEDTETSGRPSIRLTNTQST